MHRYLRRRFALMGALGTTMLTACSGGQTVVPVTPAVSSADTTATSATRETLAASAALAVTIAGLPAGIGGFVTVYGPNGWSTNLKTSATLTNRTLGTYNVVAASFQYAGKVYAPTPSAQTKTLNTYGTTLVSVTYAAVPQYGTLFVGINGLPYGLRGNVAVSGPNGWVLTLATSTNLTNRPPGNYTLVPANVSYAGKTYAATPASQTKNVSADTTTVATISYAQVIQPPPPPPPSAGDQYPYRDGAVDLVDKWGFYTRECVSYVAWRLNQDGIPFKNDYKMGPRQYWGDASHWLTAAAVAGVRVDHTPSVGAVAWIHYTKVDHVAYVSAVTSDGQVLLEEYNFPNGFHYNKRTIPASGVNWFIHFR